MRLPDPILRELCQGLNEFIGLQATCVVDIHIVRAMLPFHSNVRVRYNGTKVDGKSVLDLMTLTPPEGTKVRIRIEGPDASKAMHAVNSIHPSAL